METQKILVDNAAPEQVLRSSAGWPGRITWQRQTSGEYIAHEDGATPGTIKIRIQAGKRFGSEKFLVSFFPKGQSDTPVFSQVVEVVLAQTAEQEPAIPVSAGVILG